jgi:hypothetical protein
MKDVFMVEDEIAESVTDALKLKLLGGARQPLAFSPRSTNTEAYQAYLKANYSNGRGESLDKTLALANTAIELDQKHGPSWALRGWVEYWIADRSLMDRQTAFVGLARMQSVP